MGPSMRCRVLCWEQGTRWHQDQVVGEEPLELRLSGRTLAVTLRTPGTGDFDLAAGFLLAEGLIQSREEILELRLCPKEGSYNVVEIRLREPPSSFEGLERHFFVTSACGVCGRAGLEQLSRRLNPLPPGPHIPLERLLSLGASMEAGQRLFSSTGGLHAAALFDERGELLVVREDIGRHNAVDKAIGALLLQGRLEQAKILFVSGRSGFEIAQKALAASIPIVVSVSAPSSLALELAQEFGLTLIGFFRHHRFNLYTGADRILGLEAQPT